MTETLASAGVAHYVAPLGRRSANAVEWSQPVNVGRGQEMAAAFRGFFLLVGISAIAVVVFLIVSSAI